MPRARAQGPKACCPKVGITLHFVTCGSFPKQGDPNKDFKMLQKGTPNFGKPPCSGILHSSFKLWGYDRGSYGGYIGDNGKDNGNYYLGFRRRGTSAPEGSMP